MLVRCRLDYGKHFVIMWTILERAVRPPAYWYKRVYVCVSVAHLAASGVGLCYRSTTTVGLV